MATDRSPPSPAAPPLRLGFNQFELDEADARLTRTGRPVPLAPKPFAVLCALARTPRTLVTKNALLDSVWGHRFVTESVLKSTISELRAALEDDAKQPRYIETVSRRGYRFIAAIHGAGGAPAGLPATSGATASSLIGRVQALERLRSAWRLAAGGQRQIVWIAGEAGVGKTTLTERLIAEVGEVNCAHGQCVEQYGAGEPYLPVLEALRTLCKGDATAAGLIRSVAPTWLLQLPWLSTAEERDALRRDLAGAGPARMLREMGEFLDRYTENRPLLLVTADLHWSDQATVQLMDYIARRRSATRLMWLASFRLTELIAADHPLHAVRNELRLHRLVDEVVLDAFSEKEVAEYVATHLPARAEDAAFVRALHQRTDGLPLFVADVISEVAERGARPGGLAIPASLTGVIEAYIRELAPAERTVLEAASVCGIDFKLETVARVLERDVASVAETCAELARRQRWLSEIDERFVFRHGLYREVLYKAIARLTRGELHCKVGASLERERADGHPVSASELASHFELGGQAMPALRYYVEAAEAALARFQAGECMAITERASSLLAKAPASAQRDELEIAVMTQRGVAATRVLGAGSEAKKALQRAYSLLEHVPAQRMRGPLLHGFGYMLYMRAEYAEALSVAERAQAFGSAANDAVLLCAAYTLRGQVDHLQGRPHAARTSLERGLPFAERLEVGAGEFLVDPQVALLTTLSIPLLHLGLVEEARGCLQRANTRAGDRRWPMARLAAIWHSALLQVRLGDAARVAALAEEMDALVEEFALAHGRTACRWFRAWAAARMGQPREAYGRIREAYEENARLGMLAGSSETLGYAAEALLLADAPHDARKQVEEALQLARTLGERMYLTQLHLLDTRIADALGEADRARESGRLALAEARAQEAPWMEMLALSALCQRAKPSAEHRAALRAALKRISGGADTAPVVAARALVD